MGYFDPRYTIPIRARAYNDCAKERVLLKTRSRGGIPDPKMGPFWGLKDGQLFQRTRYPRIPPKQLSLYARARIMIHPSYPVLLKTASNWGSR